MGHYRPGLGERAPGPTFLGYRQAHIQWLISVYLPHSAISQPVIVVHRIDGAGHWTQRDQPRRFNELLLRFLAEER